MYKNNQYIKYGKRDCLAGWWLVEYWTIIQFFLCQQQRARENNDLATIQEVTGISDHVRIKRAMSECTNAKGEYDVNDVINALVCDNKDAEATSKAVGVF